jgi:predicted Rossmann-fold nucleotide-binding protein
MKKIGIIGPNTPLCSEELYRFGVELGREIAAPEKVIICGGRAAVGCLPERFINKDHDYKFWIN